MQTLAVTSGGKPAASIESVGAAVVASWRPEWRGAANVVSGGRGLGSEERFALVEQLAHAAHRIDDLERPVAQRDVAAVAAQEQAGRGPFACDAGMVAVEFGLLGVLDRARIAVAGDSAGAHLAIGCAIEARERGGPAIAFQLLVYPVVEPAFDTASYLAHASSPTLTRDDMIWYWRQYLPESADDGGARAVPTRDALAGMPRAHVVVATLDPLRDEGVALASRFERAGVAVTLAEAPSLPHGFLRAAPYAAAARSAQAALGAATRTALHG